MDEETNQQFADPQEPGGGNVDVSENTTDLQTEALTLEELNTLTGRTFANKGEALKHIEGLKSLVGDQSLAENRRKADNYDALNRKYNALVNAYATENNLAIDDAAKEIGQYLESAGAPEGEKASKVEQEITSLKKEITLDKFLSKHPEAKDHIDIIEAVADRKGVSFEEALLDSSLAKIISKPAGGATTEPNKRVQLPSQELKDLQTKLSSGQGSFEDKQKLVRELGLGK